MHTKLLAQITNPVLPAGLGSGDYSGGGTALGKIISALVGALFIAGFLLAFFTLITGGLSWITAGGEKGKLEEARNRITNAIIGLIIVASTYAIAQLVANFLGLDLKSLPIPSIMGN